MAMQRRQFVAVLVTLATANTKYNLLDLINVIMAAETQGDNTQRCPSAVRELTLTAGSGIDGTGVNTNDVLVGDALLTTTRYGYTLSPGQSRTYRGAVSDVPLGELYVQSAGTNQKLAVEVTVH